MINKLTARVALVGVLCMGGAQVFALTVEEAISATTEAGYSAVAVRTSRDGTVTSVLATDGSSYYEIDYDTESGAATSTTEVTPRDASFETLSTEDTSAAIAAAEESGLTVVAVRETDSGVEVLATDGNAMYEVSYDSDSGAATTTEATRGGRKGHGRDDRDDDDESDDDSSADADDSSDDSSDDEDDDESDDDHGGRDRDRDRDHDKDREGRGGGNH